MDVGQAFQKVKSLCGYISISVWNTVITTEGTGILNGCVITPEIEKKIQEAWNVPVDPEILKPFQVHNYPCMFDGVDPTKVMNLACNCPKCSCWS